MFTIAAAPLVAPRNDRRDLSSPRTIALPPASPVNLTLRGSLAERRSNHFRERRDTQSNWVPLSSCSQMQNPFGDSDSSEAWSKTARRRSIVSGIKCSAVSHFLYRDTPFVAPSFHCFNFSEQFIDRFAVFLLVSFLDLLSEFLQIARGFGFDFVAADDCRDFLCLTLADARHTRTFSLCVHRYGGE